MDVGKVLMLGGAGLGAYWLYEKYMAQPSALPALSSTVPLIHDTTPPMPPAPSDTTLHNATDPVAAPSVIDHLMANTIDWAAKDQQFVQTGDGVASSPYHWEFYLNYPAGPAPSGYNGGAWPPDLAQVFPAGTDLSAPMTAAQFWAGMRPYLASHGLTGLGAFCSDVTTAPGFTGPVNCDPSNGPVDYTPYDDTTQGWINLVAQTAQQNAPVQVVTPTIGGMSIEKALTLGAVGVAALFLATRQ